MKTLIAIIVLQAAAMLCIEAFAGHGEWYKSQGKELRLVCYSTVTGTKCANLWVDKLQMQQAH